MQIVVIASRKKSFAEEDVSQNSMKVIRRALVEPFGILFVHRIADRGLDHFQSKNILVNLSGQRLNALRERFDGFRELGVLLYHFDK